MSSNEHDLDWKQIGRNVFLMRKLLKTTQAELALKSNIERTSIQRVEKGQSIRMSTFAKICEGLNVSVDEIRAMKRPFGPEDASSFVAHDPQKVVWYSLGDRRTKVAPDNEALIQDPLERLRLGMLHLVPRFRSYLNFVMFDGPGVFYFEVYDRYPDWKETDQDGVYEDWIMVCEKNSVRVHSPAGSRVLAEGGAIGFKGGFEFELEPAEPIKRVEDVPRVMFIGANRREG